MGGDALGVPVHTGDLESVAHLVDATVERFGRIDIVVNNAANALITQPLGEFTPSTWNSASLDKLQVEKGRWWSTRRLSAFF
jgi:NAD(P)-dependent dehydrogenase (short-subunit alcohol dehydrogenase family)